ncbi:MAG TPA: TetR/AcrR family transcriptional regulator [Acidimicrobiales bacterium]|nr:TetR/AcrR family transcriptional regulator [Acidimicrobiales bacterium]
MTSSTASPPAGPGGRPPSSSTTSPPAGPEGVPPAPAPASASSDAARSGSGSGQEIDPRVERSRRLILAAALDLLAEVGCGGMTMEAVAARAGVGKSTVYRHWPGKLELVEDAIRTLRTVVVSPAGGTVRERLTALLVQVARGMADSTWSSCLPAIIDAAERDPEVLAIHRRIAGERRQIFVDLLSEGVASGEVAADVDLCVLAESLVGPILMRRLMLHEAFDPAAVPALVAQVLPLPPR